MTSTVIASPAGGSYLLVIDDAGSHRVPLPAAAVAVIGRGEECEVSVADTSASRRHAQLEVDARGVAVRDLDSRNGTCVNGRPIQGAAALASGDVITLGRSTIVVHLALSQPRGDALAGLEVRRRLERELVRARRHRRTLAMALVDLANTAPERALRAIGELLEAEQAAGLLDDSTLLCVLPELAPDGARSFAQAVEEALSGARAAAACYPQDAADVGGLFAAARAVLTGASETIEIGDIVVVAADPAMARTYDLLRSLAQSPIPVLVIGETGAGKEMAARALHTWSDRAAGPLVAVNCAALPATLVESELFGYEKGAFSGAERTKPGLMEQACGGTLFLDEIGELSPGAQAKLLRALEQRSVVRLGGVEPVALDFRLVAATNREVAQEIAAGRLREDLYYRVAAALVELPPLRDRPRDIPLLAKLFLDRACERLGRGPMTLSADAMRLLLEHRFPGNVRELANAMEFAAATGGGDLVEPWQLPSTVRTGPSSSSEASASGGFRPIAEEVEELERRRMQEALEAADGNQSRAAELIAMPRRSFVTKMKRYNLRG